MSIFFLILIGLAGLAIKLIYEVKKIVHKAEDVVNSVESATDVLKDAKGRMALYKLIKNIVKIVARSRR